ncbi:MAG TPA: heavy metal-associated domain-containing protein [Flavobacterium sp.]|jgi:Cu+-exporting ATPase
MKITNSLFAFAAAGLILTGCKDSAKSPETVAVSDQAAVTADAPAGKLETASFNIEGMSCAVGCAKTLEKKLSGMEGVQNASVDFEKKTATVKYDSAKQSPESFVEAVEAAAGGKTYKVSNVKSSADQAFNYGDPKKDKKKKKAKKDTAEKKEGCATDANAGAKPACCAAKKSCHGDEKSAL